MSASIPAAFANGGSIWVGGELGFESHPVQSNKSRAVVQKEFEAFRANPVTSDGGTLVGGEAGYVHPQDSYAFQGGKLVRTDTIAQNTPKPSPTMTDVERQLFKEQSIN